jgi:hypothetical protein
MNHPRTKVEGQKLLDQIKDRNYRNKERIQSVRMVVLQLDNDRYPKSEARAQRKEECLCAVCFYLDKYRVGGAAITNSNCSYCMKETFFSSTCTDDFCLECAQELKICKRCGADMDLKDRRKL